ncbi:phosphonate C-P lyase system protein PhnH [Peteryoungia ipomoeae]|uniref:Phosphonate C-P lyase system protein PhnH n=1 Tax=Peteryoungia ipomoeae TaxID=1210932 RepID=A0A4S8NXH1_9HYPH|nr:phosphonate C-P lyase system protein PhnH [Peteryoungia ipomoeae]THV22310.1 phosphonate C-P lyase system protein PhnH [Peteryoungia ipomoeae]
MHTSASSLVGAFADPVHDAQGTFRQVMDAMARPGSLQTMTATLAPPPPLDMASGALLLTLCDQDTPVWLAPSLAQSSLPAWIGFHTGAPVVAEKADARFAFSGLENAMPVLMHFAQGTQEYPDRSTTLVVQLASLHDGLPLILTGPGIRNTASIAPRGLPDTFLRQWMDNRGLFPRGVDLILTAGREFIALPRTCAISQGEA